MVFGREGWAKTFARDVGLHKKGIHAGRAAADQVIAFRRAKRLKCAERGSKIIGAVPDEGWVVDDWFAYGRRKCGVLFNHYQARPHPVDRRPDPIVIEWMSIGSRSNSPLPA
jgi:hypothetical protein